MRKVIFTMLVLIIVGKCSFGQWVQDSIVMGPGAGNDVFYSLQNGGVKTENNKNWHIAFSLGSITDSAAVWANHHAGSAFVKVYNVHKDISQWSSVVLNDTLNATLSFNNDQRWTQGAFNMASSSPTQYGWGHYAGAPSHDIIGDSIYIVNANGIFYKFFINSLTGVGPQAGYWNIQTGDFSGNTTYDTIKPAAYANRRFAYYDLGTGVDTNREPAKTLWDFVFTRYETNDPLSGSQPFNNVVGALSNVGVKVSKANLIHVDTALSHYGDYVMPWPSTSTVISNVGWNWKTLVSVAPPTYITPDSISYFVQDLAGSLYQLQFLGYTGSSTGVIQLRKRLVVPTYVHESNSLISSYEFYPNPIQNELNIVLNSKENTDATLIISDLNGCTMFSTSFKLSTGINTYSLPITAFSNGNYVAIIRGDKMQISQKITISK